MLITSEQEGSIFLFQYKHRVKVYNRYTQYRYSLKVYLARDIKSEETQSQLKNNTGLHILAFEEIYRKDRHKASEIFLLPLTFLIKIQIIKTPS